MRLPSPLFRSGSLALLLALALAALSPRAAAADLLLDGQQDLLAPVGSGLTVTLTGTPGSPALLLLDVDPGPTLLFGESVELGFTPVWSTVVTSFIPAGGTLSIPAVIPDEADLAGATVYLLGVVLDPGDPNGKDFSNGASLTLTLSVAAGATGATIVDRPLSLDGSGSANANGDLPAGTSILWDVLSAPPGANPTLADATGLYPAFTPDLPGDYVIRSTLSNHAASFEDTTTVHVWRLDSLASDDGSFIPGTATFVEGVLVGPPVDSLSIDGIAVGVDGTGHFGPELVSFDAGAVHRPVLYEAIHADGSFARVRHTLIQGFSASLASTVFSDLSAQLEASDLQLVGDAGAEILATTDITSLLLALGPQQIANNETFGFTWFSATIEFTGITFDPNVNLVLTPTAAGIQADVTLFNVRADFDVYGEVLEIDYNLDGYITTSPTVISGLLVGSASGGQIQVDTQNVQVDRQNFDFELTGFVGTVAEAFVIESAVKEDVEAAMESAIGSDMGPAVADILNQFVVAGNLFETLDVDVDIAAPVSGVVHSDHGVTIRLDATANAVSSEPGSPALTRFRSTPSSPALFGPTTAGGNPYGSALALGDDFINLVLAASTKAGLLDGDLTSLIPQKGTVPIDLVVEDLAVLFPGGGFEHFPVGTSALLDAHGTVALVLEGTPGGLGMARLHLAGLEVEFVIPGPFGNAPLLRVVVDGIAETDLTIGLDGMLSATVVSSSLTFTMVRSFPGADPAVIDQNVAFLETILNFALPDLVAALGGIPLPSLEAQGLGLDATEVALIGDDLIFYGTLITNDP